MYNYLDLMYNTLYYGTERTDRTGTGTIGLFSQNLRFDLNEGFPLVTTKFVNYKAVLAELLWFISGSTNIKDLDSKIWDAWATPSGEIGQMYGYQWMLDNQLEEVIENIKKNPYSRRHVVSAWNRDYLPDENKSPQENVENGKMALAPCHHFFQFHVSGDELNLHFSMRSNDVLINSTPI